MKYLLILALGFALGAYVFRYHPPFATTTVQADPRDPIDDKLREWHLYPSDIRNDLSRTGEVVRTQAAKVGDRLSDTRIVGTIKAKYLLDRDLSSCSIHVDVHGGVVTLTGTVPSVELIGRAVGLALDTDSVTNVTARLQLGPAS